MVTKQVLVKNVVAAILLSPLCMVRPATPQVRRAVSRCFVDFDLAGAHISLSQKEFHKFDRKSGYHLVSKNEFNHEYVSLTLTRNGTDSKKPLQHVKLGSLRTGHDVSIGDTSQKVRVKLGRPLKEFSDQDWDNDGRTDLLYGYTTVLSVTWPGSGKKVERLYSGIYLFSQNRLKEISYQLEELADEHAHATHNSATPAQQVAVHRRSIGLATPPFRGAG